MQAEGQQDIEKLTQIRNELAQLAQDRNSHAQFEKTQEMFNFLQEDAQLQEMAKRGHDLDGSHFLSPLGNTRFYNLFYF